MYCLDICIWSVILTGVDNSIVQLYWKIRQINNDQIYISVVLVNKLCVCDFCFRFKDVQTTVTVGSHVFASV